MHNRKRLLKQTILLLTEYTFPYQNLFKIYRNRVVFVHWKDIKTKEILGSIKLMEELFYEILDKSEIVTKLQVDCMRWNINNMIDTLDYAMSCFNQKKIFIHDKNPSIQLKAIFIKLNQLLINKEQDFPSSLYQSMEKKDEKPFSRHPVEEQLINASFENILKLIKEFPLNEFKTISNLNKNNALIFNKNGEFIISEQSFFKKLFGVKNPPPLQFIKNILSKALMIAYFFDQAFEHKILILAYPPTFRKELRLYLDILANTLNKCHFGITRLEYQNKADAFISYKLKGFKIDLLAIMSIIEKCSMAIPVHSAVEKIMDHVNNMNDKMLSGSAQDLAETCIQSDAIIHLTKIAGNNGITIRDISKNIKIETLATLREYLDYAENALDIETSEDYFFALQLCRDTITASLTLKEEGVDILKRAKKLETHILGKLEYIKKQEENLELLIENTTSSFSL